MAFSGKELPHPTSSWRERGQPFCYTVTHSQLRPYDAYGVSVSRKTSPACLCRRGYSQQHDPVTFPSGPRRNIH